MPYHRPYLESNRLDIIQSLFQSEFSNCLKFLRVFALLFAVKADRGYWQSSWSEVSLWLKNVSFFVLRQYQQLKCCVLLIKLQILQAILTLLSFPSLISEIIGTTFPSSRTSWKEKSQLIRVKCRKRLVFHYRDCLLWSFQPLCMTVQASNHFWESYTYDFSPAFVPPHSLHLTPSHAHAHNAHAHAPWWWWWCLMLALIMDRHFQYLDGQDMDWSGRMLIEGAGIT